MDIKLLMQLLQQVANEQHMSCYLVGGIPRDKVLGTLISNFNDIDVTTGTHSTYFAKMLIPALQASGIQFTVKQAKDGHVAFYFPDLQLDFSSNFLNPNIDKLLYSHGIKQSNAFLKEAFSRDFTVNTLLMSLDFTKIKDITGQAIKDIKGKVIKTCLPPEITLVDNPKRIIRVVYMAAKLEFDVDEVVVQWIQHNPQYLLQVEQSYLSRYIDKSLHYDKDRTVYLINKMQLWNYLPITQQLYPYMRARSRQEVLHAK